MCAKFQPNWHLSLQRQLICPPLAQLTAEFGLLDAPDWPNAEGLNQLCQQCDLAYQVPDFVDALALECSNLSYEEFIAARAQVPTRSDNWHDLFNGLIWLSFPRTKKLLNQLHIEDIKRFGSRKRSPRRDRITHFDECGLVLAYSNNELIEALAEHRWQWTLFEQRHCWGKQIEALVFGHANLEMLLNPFIGLTGKWLAVEVAPDFFSLPKPAQWAALDKKLAQHIQYSECFDQPKPTKPLPLLGVPGWYDANNDAEFYLNTDYFRPKPK